MGVPNTMSDLNDHFFEELERLGNEDLTDEQLDQEIKRAQAIAEIGRAAIENASVVLQAEKFRENRLSGEAMPRMLLGGGHE